MQLNNCEINILINGRKASEYQSPMDFQKYIEGRHDSEFEIEVVNNNAVDVEAILSIDGLSVTDGKPAGENSGGYLVKANSRFTVPGWMVDGEKAARFQFSGSKGGSYVEQSGGDVLNKGVIGAKIFARKEARPVFVASGITRGISKGGFVPTGSPMGMLGSVSTSAGAVTMDWSDASYSVVGSSLEGMTANSALNSVRTASAADLDFSDTAPAVEQTLGTKFGSATDFKTSEVDFVRADMLAVMVLYYDDRQGLKRRGIDVTQSSVRPSAFPADEVRGCTPPVGWDQ